jgi:glycosyltransferase involved in cell wall biosynthesis
MSNLDLSFVFPCLDERETLEACIREVQASLDERDIAYEIVVADNGSVDGSQQIARDAGARVCDVPKRGYGAALQGGIAAANGRYVMFADADGSYLLEHAGSLYDTTVAADADMGIASRMRGVIEPGAMPWLHRTLGTPVLTLLINLLFRASFSDCNSGFRCLRTSAVRAWDVRANGMEFASELLIKATKANASVVEIPSGLRPDKRSRAPHLHTWRDGMRHLLFILSERPELFELVGLSLVMLTTILQMFAIVLGPVEISGMHIFDYHSQLLLLMLGCVGLQIYLLSFYLYFSGEEPPRRITRSLLSIDEAHLFFLLVFLVVCVFGGGAYMIWDWAQGDFREVDLVNLMVFVTHLLCMLGFSGTGLLGIHMYKKRRM